MRTACRHEIGCPRSTLGHPKNTRVPRPPRTRWRWPGRMTVQFAPAGTRIMEVSRHRVLSSATAPIQRSLTIKVRGFPSRWAKRIGGLRRVFLHQSTARRFTTLRAAPRRNNDGVWTVTFYPSRLARSQCSTLPAGSGLRDGGIDAGGSLAEYWCVIKRATDER